jgi:hypothetical protein
MRRVFYALVGVVVLTFGLLRCWQGSKQEPRQPHGLPTADSQGVDPVSKAPEATSAPAIANRDANIDAGPFLVDKESFIRRLHALEGTNPQLAATLALEDRQRSPNSPDAEERDVVLVAALNNGRDIQGAKREAWYYFMHYPNGKYTKYLSTLTGLKPPKTPPHE